MAATAATESAASTASTSFRLVDWALVTSVALMWGSSFLFIKEALVHLRPGAVVFLRLTFGCTTLCITLMLIHDCSIQRVAHSLREAITCAGSGRIVLVALTWMALPLAAVAIGQQWVGSGLAGMIFASPPIWSTLVNALLTRTVPAPLQLVGLVLGFVGVVLILWPTLDHGARSSAVGLALMLFASVVVSVGTCVAAPLQRKATSRAGPLGFLPTLTLALAASMVCCAPFGVYGLLHSSPSWGSLAAEVALGSLSTGVAYLCVAAVVGRVGPARGLVGNYFLPVVSTVEGALVFGERIPPLAILGAVVVTAGAWLTSRKGRPVASGTALTSSSTSTRPSRVVSEAASRPEPPSWDMRTLPGVVLVAPAPVEPAPSEGGGNTDAERV